VPFGPRGRRLLAGPALRILAIDFRDDVAAAHALPVGRRSFEQAHRRDVAIDHLDGDTQAVVAALLALAHLPVRARVEEARVRVQRLQHAGDGAVDDAIAFRLLHVVGLDQPHGRGERAKPLGQPLLARGAAPAEQAAGDGRHDEHRDNGEGEPDGPHADHRTR
jgi:hypothetical protein